MAASPATDGARATAAGAIHPVFLFAVASGLSTDCGVFLLARSTEGLDAAACCSTVIARACSCLTESPGEYGRGSDVPRTRPIYAERCAGSGAS